MRFDATIKLQTQAKNGNVWLVWVRAGPDSAQH